MTIAMLRARASSVMKGNRLILMVGYVLSLVSWTLKYLLQSSGSTVCSL